MEKTIKSFIDAAYSHGFTGEGFSFVLVMDTCCSQERRKMFYFHKAKVKEWKMSIWKCDPFRDYPAQVVLESASGLQLVWHNDVGLSVINTKRFKPSYRRGDVRKVNVRYEQSMKNLEIAFYQTD